MGLSDKCPDLKTRWDRILEVCVPCPRKPGHEVNPNCGFDDYGGRHAPPITPCKPDTFNDDSSAYCKPCALCPHGFIISSPCNSTIDTKCEETRHPGTEVPVNNQTSQGPTSSPNATSFHSALWTVPLAILVMVVVFSAYIFYMKRKKGQNTVMNYSRRSSYIKAGFTPLSAEALNNDLKDVLSPNVMSAPLQTVLDNLDVLEDLVILLDPESHGVKNTKHLASHCSFTSTWITYTYSMKDSKSPLKAVLEGVTSRHPDWTVGHLAKLLRQMERNDAIAVLAKIRLSEMDV